LPGSSWTSGRWPTSGIEPKIPGQKLDRTYPEKQGVIANPELPDPSIHTPKSKPKVSPSKTLHTFDGEGAGSPCGPKIYPEDTQKIHRYILVSRP
jgi:hypothetical protein